MKKSFDCVEMKNRLQAEMLEWEALLGPEEARRKRQQWLATGDDELAKWWRSLAPVRKPDEIPVAVRDDQTPYGTGASLIVARISSTGTEGCCFCERHQ